MYCHADSKDFLDNRIEKCNRIESMDSMHSYASSNDDALNSSCSSFLRNSIDWQTQSPVTVSRADAVMALIQEELYQGQSLLQNSRIRSVSAPSILSSSPSILSSSLSILSSSPSILSSSPSILSSSPSISAYSTLDKRKIKAINDMKNFVTRIR
jgi:hypothetical protein